MRGACRYIHNYEDYLANEEAQVPPWEDEWRSELWGDEAHLEAPHRREVIVTVSQFPGSTHHAGLLMDMCCLHQCFMNYQCNPCSHEPAALNASWNADGRYTQVLVAARWFIDIGCWLCRRAGCAWMRTSWRRRPSAT